MLADKTGVEKGHAWLVKSSFCQKARYMHARSRTRRKDVHAVETEQKRKVDCNIHKAQGGYEG